MTRSQYCREHIDKVAEACGLEKSTVSDVKQAAKFCDDHSDLSDCSTRAIMALIRVRDDLVRDNAISSIEKSFDSGKHPLTGQILKKKVLTEREVKAIIGRAEIEVRKELMKEGDSTGTVPVQYRCMYLDKSGTGCYANAAYQEKCTPEVRRNRNCPLPTPSGEVPQDNPDDDEDIRDVAGPESSANSPHEPPGWQEYLNRQVARCRQKNCHHLVESLGEAPACTVMMSREDMRPWRRYDCPLRPEVQTVKPVQRDRSRPDRATTVAGQQEGEEPPSNIYRVKAGRYEQATIDQMVKYGDAINAQEAVEIILRDGAALWLDRIENRLNGGASDE